MRMSASGNKLQHWSRRTPSMENGTTIVQTENNASQWATVSHDPRELRSFATNDCWTRFCDRMWMCLNKKSRRKSSQVHPVKEENTGEGLNRNGSVIVCDIVGGEEEEQKENENQRSAFEHTEGNEESREKEREVEQWTHQQVEQDTEEELTHGKVEELEHESGESEPSEVQRKDSIIPCTIEITECQEEKEDDEVVVGGQLIEEKEEEEMEESRTNDHEEMEIDYIEPEMVNSVHNCGGAEELICDTALNDSKKRGSFEKDKLDVTEETKENEEPKEYSEEQSINSTLDSKEGEEDEEKVDNEEKDDGAESLASELLGQDNEENRIIETTLQEDDNQDEEEEEHQVTEPPDQEPELSNQLDSSVEIENGEHAKDEESQEREHLEHEIISEGEEEIERSAGGEEIENHSETEEQESCFSPFTGPRFIPPFDDTSFEDDDAEVVIMAGTSTPNYIGSGSSTTLGEASGPSITDDGDHHLEDEEINNNSRAEDAKTVEVQQEESDEEEDIKCPVNRLSSAISSAEDEAKEKVSTPMAAAIKSAFSYKSSLHNRILSKEIQDSSNDDVAFGILNETRKGEENQEVTSELSTTSTATGSSRSSQQQQPTGQTSSAASIARRLESLQDYDEAKTKALSRTLSVQTLPSIDSNVEPRPKTSISLNANIPFDDIPIKTRYSSTLSLAQTSRNLDEVDHQLVLEKSFSTFDLKSPRIHSDGGDLLEMKPMRSNAASRPLQRNATEFIKSPKNYLKRGNRKIFPTKIPTSNISPVKVNKVNSNNKYKEYPRSPVMGHFDRPKEAYSNCIAQLDDSNWETVMIGLKNFLRMIRHHPEYIDPHIHVIAGIMAKHVRNLRSQVSRAACQATDEFFYTHHKLLETEADDLVTTLLSRTADTNRFLRKDATKALESMCDNLPTQKVIQLLSTRGMSHQNALVRTTTSYLLCRSVVNLGADKVYSLNKDSRDRIFITGAQLLTEGSLETRSYAKQMFRLLSSHIKYQKVLLEVIPNKLYRNIEKTLKKV